MLPAQYTKITSEGVRGMILHRLETGSASWVSEISMRMTSSQAAEDYGWLGNVPGLREFVGGRTPKEIAEKSFIVTNEDYEGSIIFLSKDVRRDKLGMITTRVNQLADRALDHPAKLLSSLIMSGESEVCYDGQYFFDTDHSEGVSGSQSNDITHPVVLNTAPTSDEMAKAIVAGIQAMYALKDDQGEPMNQSAMNFMVMVPVPFMGVALEAVAALLGSGGATATIAALKGNFTINVVTNPRLTWTTKFAIFRTDEAAKPFILQEEDIPDVIALGEGTEYEQLNKKHLYGVDWTGNVAFGYWQHGVLVSLTTI